MTKPYHWLPLACVAAAAACNGRQTPPPLSVEAEPRACLVAASADARGDAEIVRLQKALREPRRAAAAAEDLAYRFISRARLMNDAGDYTVAGQAATCLEALKPGDATGELLRGHVLHQQHHFHEAETVARHLVTRRQYVLDYGLLGDALMEQGRLGEAAAAYQTMIDLKPFYQSYTRAAHLRWLKGNLDGAIELTHLAVNAASPDDPESVAWAYTRLGLYELQRARFNDARRMIDAALQFVPDYPAALLLRGRLLLAEGHASDAIVPLQRAADLNPLPEYLWTLADALRRAGRTDAASSLEERIVNEGPRVDPRTTALFLATRGRQVDMAVDLARREMENRGDIFTLDALAWSLASAGDRVQAMALIERALAEGTRDGRLFAHATVIARLAGRPEAAARWALQARALRFTLLPSEVERLRSAPAQQAPLRGE